MQYLSIRYTERLAEAGAVTSVGSRGDSYDNALAESVIGLYKAELVERKGPWRGLDDLEYATLDWVDWFNHRRLFSAIGYVPRALRNTQSWNGWVDWRFRGEKLADLRNRLPMQEEPSGQQGGCATRKRHPGVELTPRASI